MHEILKYLRHSVSFPCEHIMLDVDYAALSTRQIFSTRCTFVIVSHTRHGNADTKKQSNSRTATINVQ